MSATGARGPSELLDAAADGLATAQLYNRPSAWATAGHLVFPAGSPIEGPFSLDVFPPQRAVMDACGPLDPCAQVTIMASAQSGKTTAAFCAIGQRIDEYPTNILYTIGKAQDIAKFGETKWRPFAASSSRLSAKLGAGDEVDNALQVGFRGGSLIFGGAKIPDTFRAIPYEMVILDDLDAMPENPEGDLLELARGRTTMYRLRSPKVVAISSPVLVGGPIDTAYRLSSQEQWFCPCLRCGHMQTLDLPMLIWKPGQWATAHFVCVSCNHRIQQHQIKAMNAAGEWRAAHPERIPYHRGFRLSQAFAPIEFASWAAYAQRAEEAEDEYAATGREGKRKAVRNTMAGLPYESVGNAAIDKISAATRARAEQPWVLDSLPVVLRAAGADLGEHGITTQVLGCGPLRERWVIHHENQSGNIRYDSVWDAWVELLAAHGVHAVCVDASWQQDVVCRQLLRLSVRLFDAGIYAWAVKGDEGEGMLWPGDIDWGAIDAEGNVRPVTLKVDSAKAEIYDSLAVGAKSGPGVFHFTVDRKRGYFRQLFSERRREAGDKGGKRKQWYRRSARVRAEVLDTMVYAIAAEEACAAHWPQIRASLDGVLPAASSPQPSPQSVTAQTADDGWGSQSVW